MRVILSVIASFIAGWLLFPSHVFSGDEITVQFSFGIVKDISAEKITVTEYNYESDEETENSYFFDESTELNGAGSFKDIAVDDSVDIVYRHVDGKNIAQSISVEKPSDENGMPDEPADGPDKTSEIPVHQEWTY